MKNKDDSTLEIKVEDLFIGEPIPGMPGYKGKVDYAQARCKKKKYNKEYFVCKEREKVLTCSNAIRTGQHYYCSRPKKK